MLNIIKVSGLAVLLGTTSMAANADTSYQDTAGVSGSSAEYVQVAETTVTKNNSLEDEKAAIGEKFEEWSNKISEGTEEATDEASDALNEAWEDVSEAWDSLQEATEENWEAAKENYDEAVVRLEKAWDEMTSES